MVLCILHKKYSYYSTIRIVFSKQMKQTQQTPYPNPKIRAYFNEDTGYVLLRLMTIDYLATT